MDGADALYGVLGMMVVIALITWLLLRAPRRDHAWQKRPVRAAKPERALRQARWRVRERVLESIGASTMVSYAKTTDEGVRIAIRNVGPNLEGAALVLDRSLIDPALEAVLEDGGGAWQGEIDHQRVEVGPPLPSDEADVASLRKWLAPRLEASMTSEARAMGEVVMISLPAIDYRVPFERPLLREHRALAIEHRAELAQVSARNAEERAWIDRAREAKTQAARAAMASDETLRDLERDAAELDELADRKDDPQALIDAGAKRRFLLVQMAAFSLLDPAERELAASLERRGHARLAAYHRAACRLHDYLVSDARAEIVGVSAPSPAAVAVLAAPLSLDLFRRGTLVCPSDASPNEMLARAEAELLHDVANAESTFVFIKSGGLRHTITCRYEDGIRFVLSGLSVTRV
jgi:hypothetical protein